LPSDGIEAQEAPVFTPDAFLVRQTGRWELTGLDVRRVHRHILKKFKTGLTTTAEALSPLYLKSPSR